VRTPLEVDRPHQIDLVELVRGPGLGTEILLARQRRGEPDAGVVPGFCIN
jgi:hypothetical protein